MLTKNFRKLLVAIAIGTDSVTYNIPVPTASPDNDPTAEELLSTASLPSVTIPDVEADTFEKVEAVEQTDAPLNPSLDGVSIEPLSIMASPYVPIHVGASESGTSDKAGELPDVPLSPSSLVPL